MVVVVVRVNKGSAHSGHSIEAVFLSYPSATESIATGTGILACAPRRNIGGLVPRRKVAGCFRKSNEKARPIAEARLVK